MKRFFALALYTAPIEFLLPRVTQEDQPIHRKEGDTLAAFVGLPT